MFRTAVAVTLVLCWVIHPAGAFSKHRAAHKADGGFLKTDTLRGDLQAAMAEALGQDHDVEFVQDHVIRQWLAPMFKALPQIQSHKGHVDLRVMEHALHRYFMKRYSISLRPFEPHRNMTASELGATDLIADRAPAFVEEVLRGRFNHNGFSLDDAVSMVATMEQFLYDDTLRRVSKAHDSLPLPDSEEITTRQALEIIGLSIRQVKDEPQGDQGIVSPTSGLDWGTESIITGELERIVFKRSRTMGKAALKQNSFTLEEVAHAAHALVLSSQQYFSDCEGLRNHMASFDPKKTGRAVLSDMYWHSDTTGFEIRESKDWLKRLGALDESSVWKGPQIIIPNYVAGASNCIMTTSLYRVCCPNAECENLLSRMEEVVAGPTGKPQDIMPIILQESISQGDQRDVHTMMPLSKKLWDIAKHHGMDDQNSDGMLSSEIPLNGRLFQQWLHYVKPQHCPYPHKRGTVEALNLAGCGKECALDDTKAAAKEVAYTPEGPSPEEGTHDDAWMSQWALEEELLVNAKAPAGWMSSESIRRMKAFAVATVVSIVFLVFLFYGYKAASAWGLCPPLHQEQSNVKGRIMQQSPSWPSTKSHLV